ncbi:hypothetical protein [Actinoplanes sp. URMC 104]|uniref:hypothetical protein n=1 Tax=Actinoplanes sp. URMC 104 TaxID=3423409 RepID=UPI003F198879
MTGRPKTSHGGGGTPRGPGRHRAPGVPRQAGSVAQAQQVVAAFADAGRPGSGAADGRSSPSSLVHGGHSSRPHDPADFERQARWANAAYDDIRANSDAEVIAGHLRGAERLDGSTGFTVREIDRIRHHVFFEEHPLSDYEGGISHQRYDASPDMAEAWLRLRSGRPLPEDIALLEHESAESRYYAAHPGATYEEAHRAANQVSDWQNRIPDPTFEDYSTPWRQPWA